MQLKQELDVLEAKIKQGKSESLVDQKQKVEADLKALQQNNSYRNELIRLSSRFREDQKVNEVVRKFSAQMQELNKGCSAQ